MKKEKAKSPGFFTPIDIPPPPYKPIKIVEEQEDDTYEEIKVCPVMTCDSCLLFPEFCDLPCARHGIMMVKWSDAPLRKKIYRFIKGKIFKYKYVTHRVKKGEK